MAEWEFSKRSPTGWGFSAKSFDYENATSFMFKREGLKAGGICSIKDSPQEIAKMFRDVASLIEKGESSVVVTPKAAQYHRTLAEMER